MFGLPPEDVRTCDSCEIQHEWGELKEIPIFGDNMVKLCEKCCVEKILNLNGNKYLFITEFNESEEDK